jgi:hypothetical protein
MIYHPRHITRKIEQVSRAIDTFLNQPPPPPTQTPLTAKIEQIGNRVLDIVAICIFTVSSTLDGMRDRCPRCRNEWSDRGLKYGHHKCGACKIEYVSQEGTVSRYNGENDIYITWHIDEHNVELVQGNRPPFTVAWFPYDYTQEDIEKYLVIA